MKNIQLSKLNRKEVLRYMGFHGEISNSNITDLLDSTEKLVLKTANPQYVWRLFTRENCPLNLLTEQGADIAAHLENCHHIVFLCATIGPQIDRLTRQLQVTDMAASVVADSFASVAVEQVCDKLELEIVDAVKKTLGDVYFTFRFSCGYGDFPLSVQSEFLKVLDASRKVGITVTEGGLMSPLKSVSAVIGISDKPVAKDKRNCKSCPRRDTCTIRDRSQDT